MKYAVIRNEHGDEIPLIFGNNFDTSRLHLLGKIVAAGDAKVHEIMVTCEGTMIIDGAQVVSRGLKDEILLRSSDFMGNTRPEE